VPFGVENILHFAGGIFLLYLAIGAFKSFKNYSFTQTTEPHSAGQNFIKGVIVNLLNPNPYLAWSLVMGPLLLKGWHEAPGNGITLILSFYITLILSSFAIILIFSTLRKLGTKITRILVGISIIALAGFGFYQLWLGITSL
jgi:threonine/homoserine/homoserine lactone efflux protein